MRTQGRREETGRLPGVSTQNKRSLRGVNGRPGTVRQLKGARRRLTLTTLRSTLRWAGGVPEVLLR